MKVALRAILLATSGVTALVATRINWGTHPQGAALPAIVLNVIDDADGYTLAGPDGLSQGRVQVDCYATSPGAADRLAEAVIAALSGYSDSNFRGVFRAGKRDGREGGSNEADRPFRVSLDFITNWRTT